MDNQLIITLPDLLKFPKNQKCSQVVISRCACVPSFPWGYPIPCLPFPVRNDSTPYVHAQIAAVLSSSCVFYPSAPPHRAEYYRSCLISVILISSSFLSLSCPLSLLVLLLLPVATRSFFARKPSASSTSTSHSSISM